MVHVPAHWRDSDDCQHVLPESTGWEQVVMCSHWWKQHTGSSTLEAAHSMCRLPMLSVRACIVQH